MTTDDETAAGVKKRKPEVTTAAAPYVLIPLFCAITGYSEKAVRLKIQRGVWLENREWRKAPDGRILISMRDYEKWVTSA